MLPVHGRWMLSIMTSAIMQLIRGPYLLKITIAETLWEYHFSFFNLSLRQQAKRIRCLSTPSFSQLRSRIYTLNNCHSKVLLCSSGYWKLNHLSGTLVRVISAQLKAFAPANFCLIPLCLPGSEATVLKSNCQRANLRYKSAWTTVNHQPIPT